MIRVILPYDLRTLANTGAEVHALEPPGAPLPDAVASGAEPFWIVGAIAGG
jgi:hypothetical protein